MSLSTALLAIAIAGAVQSPARPTPHLDELIRQHQRVRAGGSANLYVVVPGGLAVAMDGVREPTAAENEQSAVHLD